MNKNLALFLSAVLILGAVSTVKASETGLKPDAVINESTIPKSEVVEPPISITAFEYDPRLYPKPNLNHAVSSYKKANYTGAAQELLSYLAKHPDDAKAYYYMAVTLANLGDTDAAITAYEKVIILNPNEGMVTYAAKGRDCLTGGPLCAESGLMEGEEPDPLDEFINAPYGDGFSPELKEQMKYKDLENIQKNINRKPTLDPEDVQEIKDFDKEHSGMELTDNKIALADGEVSNDEIVEALHTLQKAGMNVSIQPSTPNPAAFQDSQAAQMSMMLGGNRNNNDPMTQMLPYMMQAGTKDGAQNVDPQVLQTMMMSSMLNNLDFNTSDNDR